MKRTHCELQHTHMPSPHVQPHFMSLKHLFYYFTAQFCVGYNYSEDRIRPFTPIYALGNAHTRLKQGVRISHCLLILMMPVQCSSIQLQLYYQLSIIFTCWIRLCEPFRNRLSPHSPILTLVVVYPPLLAKLYYSKQAESAKDE